MRRICFAVLLIGALAAPLTTQPRRTAVHADTRSDLAKVSLAVQGDGLGTAWCGDPRADDDTVHAVHAAAVPQVKVVYAHAADRPNRFAAWAGALQADVAIVQRFLAAQAGGTKAIRFDMGTRCGPEFADIQTVTLPGPHATFAGNFRAIASAVQDTLGEGRNAIILADSLSPTGHDYGLGETLMGADGEQPGPSNPHNLGGLSGVLFSRDGGEPPTGDAGWWAEGFLHEITHTLGAVQWGAPNSTQPPGGQDARYGHCFQGVDVMCYAEDESAAQQVRTDCVPLEGAITASYDCGRDDYFNPAPPPGSYLATHWNVYDSVFLAPCAEITPACGGGTAPRPPAVTDDPSIRRHGRALKARPGEWLNQPTRYEFQWQRRTGTRWINIRGATRARYVPTKRDAARRLRITVLATNPDGTTAATSDAVSPRANRVDRRQMRRR